MITFKSRFLTWGEAWFDDEPERAAVDCMIYLQRSAPVPGSKTKHVSTYLIDLTQTTEQLVENLKGDTWRKIKRAREQDKILCECRDARDRAVMKQFEGLYNAFAAIKGINPLYRRRLESLAAAGALDFSVAKSAGGEVLLYHANYRGKDQVSGIHSVSLFRNHADSAYRNMISRANCFLTWTDLLRYKELGVKSYDFGGWYQGSDPAMQSINRFKTKFGGEVVSRYQCEKIMTLKGWIVLRGADLLKRAKLLSPLSNGRAMPPEPRTSPACA